MEKQEDWIPAPEAGETEYGPWEVFRISGALLAYGITEENARTIAQRLNGY